jgi:hypothetical protein
MTETYTQNGCINCKYAINEECENRQKTKAFTETIDSIYIQLRYAIKLKLKRLYELVNEDMDRLKTEFEKIEKDTPYLNLSDFIEPLLSGIEHRQTIEYLEQIFEIAYNKKILSCIANLNDLYDALKIGIIRQD